MPLTISSFQWQIHSPSPPFYCLHQGFFEEPWQEFVILCHWKQSSQLIRQTKKNFQEVEVNWKDKNRCSIPIKIEIFFSFSKKVAGLEKNSGNGIFSKIKQNVSFEIQLFLAWFSFWNRSYLWQLGLFCMQVSFTSSTIQGKPGLALAEAQLCFKIENIFETGIHLLHIKYGETYFVFRKKKPAKLGSKVSHRMQTFRTCGSVEESLQRRCYFYT